MAEHQKSKEKMVQVAIDLFSTRGFKGTSIRDIAQAMNMSISNIYHYFGNKEGLLLAILKHSSKGLSDKLRQISEMDLEPLDQFKHLIKKHIELSEYYKKEFKIFFLDEEHLSPESEEINNQVQREILELYRNALKALKDSGQLQCKKITITAFNILGVINWHLRWYRPEGSLSKKEVTDEVVSFILHGVLGNQSPDTKSDNRKIK